MYFTSPAHIGRFLAGMQQIGKIDDDRLDQEYGVALYILTSHTALREKTRDYVSIAGIDIEAMLKEVDLSGGYSVLVKLAGNLFNDKTHCDAIELMRLDDNNFLVALTALQIRRSLLQRDDVSEGAHETEGRGHGR